MNTPQTCWRSSASKLRGGVWGEQVGRVCMWVEYGWAIGWSTGWASGWSMHVGGVRVGNWVEYGVGKWVEYACGWSTGGHLGGVRGEQVGRVCMWVEYGWAIGWQLGGVRGGHVSVV